MASPSLDVALRHRVHPGLTLDVRFDLGDECAVLFGASGAGKTTVLRLIAGLARPDEGTVRLGDDVLCDTARHVHRPIQRRRVGFIFQDDLLFPHMSVADNVRFGLAGWPRAEADRRLEEVSALCDVTDLLSRRPSSLSGGERQRVGLARALAPRPRLLLCDEPVSALDLSARDVLLERLASVRRVERVPMLFVTHAPAEAVTLGDRLMLLEGGRIVDQGPPLDVLARRGPRGGLSDLRNVHAAELVGHEAGSSRLRLPGGPDLIVPRCDRPVGARVVVTVRADDIILAGAGADTPGLSARNVVPGVVEGVVIHGEEAEVVVAAGATRWVVSIVSSALGFLSLRPGESCRMIFKARGCHLLTEP
jgi:molybdate transport system ATP-binding protein